MTEKNRPAIESEITQQIATNNSGAITASILQSVLIDMADSYLNILSDLPLPIILGGTGATTQVGAQSNLGIGSAGLLPASTFLHSANNLSDLLSVSTARTNLGLGTAATQPISAFLQTANNLSDVVAATARTNLGLGTAAIQSTGFFLQTANNLSDVTAATARTNLGLGTAAQQNSTAFVGTSTTSISLAVPGTYSTLQAALNAAAIIDPAPGQTITINVTGHQAAVSAIGTVQSNFAPILIRGSNPLSLTYSNVSSVSGSAGAYSVAYNVVSAGSTAVGDVLLINNWDNSFPTQGGRTGYPTPGCFEFGLSNAALNQVVVNCTAGSTGIVFNNSIATSLAGYVIGIAGQYRKIATHTAGTNTATVSSAFLQTYSSYIYWQLLAPETGTVAVSTTAVTGTSTTFSSRTDPGDLFIVCDSGQMSAISAVGSNTGLTLATSLTTVTAGATFCIAKAIWQHEGAFLVTGVSGNTITVSNTSHSPFAPPKVGMTSCTMSVIQSTLQASSGSSTGLIVSGAIDMNNIAIIGNGSTGNGIDAFGGTGKTTANIICGTAFATIGFNTGVNLSDGSSLEASGSYFCSASNAAINSTRGASANLDSAYLMGSALYSIILDGGYMRLSRSRMTCNGNSGIFTGPGASFYADWPVCNGNAGVGLQLIGATNFHYVGSQVMYNTSDGCQLQNGPTGRLTGGLFVKNTNSGINANVARAECDQSLCAANGVQGVAASTSIISLNSAGIINNANSGLQPSICSSINAVDTYIHNNAGGIYAYTLSRVDAQGTYCVGNGANDLFPINGGVIYCDGYLGSPNFGVTINNIGLGGSLVCNNTQLQFL